MEDHTVMPNEDAHLQDENLKNEEMHEESTAAEPIEKEADIKTSEELLAEEKDRYLRLYAEFENYKKRTSKEKMDFFQYANQDLMISMLAVLDDFDRAIKNMAATAAETEITGVELIYQKLKHKLIEKGLKPMEVNVGDAFNVDFHEAITQIPAPSEDLKGKIVDVVESGYLLHDRVIRFAKVVTGS